jgi:hypothetical protein
MCRVDEDEKDCRGASVRVVGRPSSLLSVVSDVFSDGVETCRGVVPGDTHDPDD